MSECNSFIHIHLSDFFVKFNSIQNGIFSYYKVIECLFPLILKFIINLNVYKILYLSNLFYI